MLMRILRTVPLDTIDRRSSAAVFMRRVREDITDQLGGDVSPAQAILIEEAAKTALIVKATGDYILRQSEGRVRDGSLLPVVVQREQLVGSLTRTRGGRRSARSERRAQPESDLEGLREGREGERNVRRDGGAIRTGHALTSGFHAGSPSP